MQRTITVETITTVDGVAALRPRYERLQRATGNTLPFALDEWHLAWCHHFLNRNPRIRDEPLFYVLRESGGTCVAVIPLILSRRRVGPLNIVSIDLLGADPAITEIRAPMIVPGYELLTAHAVQHQLTNTRGWDWIHWSGISAAFAQAMRLRTASRPSISRLPRKSPRRAGAREKSNTHPPIRKVRAYARASRAVSM
jgi:hypothetical protein